MSVDNEFGATDPFDEDSDYYNQRSRVKTPAKQTPVSAKKKKSFLGPGEHEIINMHNMHDWHDVKSDDHFLNFTGIPPAGTKPSDMKMFVKTGGNVLRWECKSNTILTDPTHLNRELWHVDDSHVKTAAFLKFVRNLRKGRSDSKITYVHEVPLPFTVEERLCSVHTYTKRRFLRIGTTTVYSVEMIACKTNYQAEDVQYDDFEDIPEEAYHDDESMGREARGDGNSAGATDRQPNRNPFGSDLPHGRNPEGDGKRRRRSEKKTYRKNGRNFDEMESSRESKKFSFEYATMEDFATPKAKTKRRSTSSRRASIQEEIPDSSDRDFLSASEDDGDGHGDKENYFADILSARRHANKVGGKKLPFENSPTSKEVHSIFSRLSKGFGYGAANSGGKDFIPSVVSTNCDGHSVAYSLESVDLNNEVFKSEGRTRRTSTRRR